MVTDDKEDKTIMKKIQHIIPGAAATLAACSLISALLLCGCSKDLQEQQAVSSLSEGDVELTIKVGSDAGTRTTIKQDDKILPVAWKTGDKLYVVGADDGYLGCLTQTGDLAGDPLGRTATFKGSVKGWSAEQVLHIYYLGDTDPSLSSGAGEYTFDISAQLGTLAGIASSGQIAHGATASLAPGTKTIATSLTMSNLNAVVLFDLSQWIDGTTITGTYNKAVLNLKTGAFDSTQLTSGGITIAAGKCTDKTYVSFIPDTTDLTFTQGTYSTPAMTNGFAAGSFSSNNGTAIDMPRLETECLLSGEFSISATVKVKFSKGNLQATCTKAGNETAAEYSWGFAKNQWDYIGKAAGNTTINKQTDGAVVDLFGWVGAGGTLTGDFTKYGISTQQSTTYYGGSATEALKADWADIPSLPQISGRRWHTLSKDDWCYLLKTRTVNGGTGEGNSYQRAYINSDGTKVYGMILYPDNYTSQTGDTSYTTDEWMTMEDAGCVFLPLALYRNESSILDSYGCYWSSTPASSTHANWMRFSKNDVTPVASSERHYGFSVRLVSVEIPEGALSGRFSVASGKRVRFSRGNLQATCTKAGTETTSEYSWGFAENQYDVIGNAEGNTTIASQTVGKKVDLFCWVGKSSTVLTGAATRYGITNSIAYSDYGTEKTTETLMDDWGNIATLPGNSESKKIWRTLTGGSDGEWKYLLETRTASTVNGQANARYAIVKVNGEVGLLLFPDVFIWPDDITKPTYINKVNESTDPNPDYTVDQFVVLQYAGCVFLPAGGRRQSSGVDHLTDGFYYSSNSRTTNISYRIAFGFNDLYSVQDSPFIDGCSVRLVTDAE